MRLIRIRLISLAALVLLLGTVLPARAHGFLVRAIPEDRATLERAPARLQYWFSETLEPEFSSLTVRDTSGTVIAEGGISPDNSTLLTARLPNNLPDGAYIVEMRLAFASDGHVIAERRTFFVGKTVQGSRRAERVTRSNHWKSFGGR
jgi:methionine-rich copper-binding protein CopC